MRFGIVAPPAPDAPHWSRVAEELGFESTWLFDSHMVYADVYATLALCAARTRRMIVGTGVAVAPSRIAPVTAAAIATLNQFYPGRAILGLGTGNTGRRTMGLPPMKLSAFKEYARVVKGLLQGETVEYTEDGITRPIRLIHPDRGIVNLDGPIPVCLAAFAPNAIQFAGELGDGFITIFAPPADVAAARTLLEKGAAKAGRDLRADGFRTICHEAIYVTRPGERSDSDDAKHAVGPSVLCSLRYWLHAGSMSVDESGKLQGAPAPLLPALERFRRWLDERGIDPDRDYARFYEHYFLQVPREHLGFLDRDVIGATTITGPPDYCLARLREYEQAGADEIDVVLGGNRNEQLIRFAREVIAKW
jgi:5,10-methylenetetrahydromethanopterin reductase